MITVLIISLIVAAILFTVYYHLCAGKIWSLNAEIKQALKAQDVAAALKKSKPIESAWKAFANSLTKADDVLYSTVDASEFFSVAALTQGLNMTFWQSFGGIFTGLGILGTFFGLTFGLYGVDMTSGDIEVLKGSIQQLLSGVETAFVTSLVGIGAAVVYSFAHHLLLKTLQGNVQKLTDKLDEIYPRRTVEDWLAENNRDIRDQTVSLKNLGESVGQMLSDGFDEKISELSDNICAAIEHLGKGGSEKVGEIFSDRVGEQMDRFSDALDRFSDSIDAKLKAADEISKIMNEQLLKTLQELSDKLNQTATDAGNAVAGNAAQITEAVKAFREIVDRHNETTKKTFDRIQQLLDETESLLESMDDASTSFKAAADPVKQSTQQLTQNLTATSAQMKTLAEANQITRENLANLSTRLATFVQNFNGIAGELERSIKIVTDSLDNYNSVTNAGLKEKLAAFDKSMNDAFSYLQQSVDDLGDIVGYVKQKRGTVIK